MGRSILAFFIWAVYKAWTSTWRKVAIESSEMKALMRDNKPIIFAMWHGNELAMISYSTIYKCAAMTSQSKDGDLMDFVLRMLGFKTSRGSSTRGGISALKGIIRNSRAGYIPVFPVDGPKGPIYQPKPGVFEMSKIMNAHIIPSGIAHSGAIHFKKSWNKTFLPLPFSRVVLYWGAPIPPVNKNQDPRDPQLAKILKESLDACGQRARQFRS